MTGSALCVLSLYVYACNCALEDVDLGAIVCTLDDTGLFFDADDLADDTADGGDLIAHGQVVAHGSLLSLLLLLGTDHKEIEYNEYTDDH